jgi:hypothetical protein
MRKGAGLQADDLDWSKPDASLKRAVGLAAGGNTARSDEARALSCRIY